jgi:hypothetical protein
MLAYLLLYKLVNMSLYGKDTNEKNDYSVYIIDGSHLLSSLTRNYSKS